jgi:hypothetical protein
MQSRFPAPCLPFSPFLYLSTYFRKLRIRYLGRPHEPIRERVRLRTVYGDVGRGDTGACGYDVLRVERSLITGLPRLVRADNLGYGLHGQLVLTLELGQVTERGGSER